MVVIFREDIGYVWMWMGILGEDGIVKESIGCFLFFLRKKGFSCGGGNCETLDWDWNFETWDREV